MAAYEALYRKWRPQTFDDIVAQPHITRTLKNQIVREKTAHAYLFVGSRGTGKTTCARIFAKAVNCLHPKDGNPCLECENCRDAEAGTLTDIIEIDGASNNGVGEVRSLRDNAAYLPVRCKYKVYIIDEVHMMSAGAFNALLKMIEEPPEYVKFILATTDLKNIPNTITSRCQRYDFRRIPGSMIAEYLQSILDANSLVADEGALKRITTLSEGSMRDALSLLDRVSTMSDSGHITLEGTLNALGRMDMSMFAAYVRNILEGRASSNIRLFNESLNKGVSEEQFLIDFLWYLKNIFLCKASGAAEKDAFSANDYADLTDLADQIDDAKLDSLIALFDRTRKETTYSRSRRVLIEVALIEAGLPDSEERMADLRERMNQSMMTMERLSET